MNRNTLKARAVAAALVVAVVVVLVAALVASEGRRVEERREAQLEVARMAGRLGTTETLYADSLTAIRGRAQQLVADARALEDSVSGRVRGLLADRDAALREVTRLTYQRDALRARGHTSADTVWAPADTVYATPGRAAYPDSLAFSVHDTTTTATVDLDLVVRPRLRTMSYDLRARFRPEVFTLHTVEIDGPLGSRLREVWVESPAGRTRIDSYVLEAALSAPPRKSPLASTLGRLDVVLRANLLPLTFGQVEAELDLGRGFYVAGGVAYFDGGPIPTTSASFRPLDLLWGDAR